MLFLKRASDVFEERYAQIMRDNVAGGRSPEEAKMRAERPLSYSNTFYVPEKARWSYIRDELHDKIGDGLNKAFGRDTKFPHLVVELGNHSKDLGHEVQLC